MDHADPLLKSDIVQPIGEPLRVIDQYLFRSDLDQRGWQAIDRAEQW